MIRLAPILLCLVLIGGLCLGKPVPPRPKIKAVAESPKGKDARMSLAKSPSRPRVVIAPGYKWTWTCAPDTNNPCSNIVFVVSMTANISTTLSNWPVLGVTATNEWPFSAVGACGFFHIQSSNTVNHMVSP